MLFGDLISPALSTAALPLELFHSKKPMRQELHPEGSAVCLGQRTTSSIPLKKLNLKPNKSPDSIYDQLQSLQSNSAVLVHGPVQWINDGSLATSDSIERFGQGVCIQAKHRILATLPHSKHLYSHLLFDTAWRVFLVIHTHPSP